MNEIEVFNGINAFEKANNFIATQVENLVYIKYKKVIKDNITEVIVCYTPKNK